MNDIGERLGTLLNVSEMSEWDNMITDELDLRCTKQLRRYSRHVTERLHRWLVVHNTFIDKSVIHSAIIRCLDLSDGYDDCQVGAELSRVIAERWNLRFSGGCGCEELASTMNMWGCKECREHFNWLVDKILRNANKRWITWAVPDVMKRPKIAEALEEAIQRAERKLVC